MMIQRRYELSDKQWEQIKDMFPPYRTGRPSKLRNCTIFYAIIWIVCSGPLGMICRKNAMAHGRRPTAVFVNGEIRNYLSPSAKRIT